MIGTITNDVDRFRKVLIITVLPNMRLFKAYNT